MLGAEHLWFTYLNLDIQLGYLGPKMLHHQPMITFLVVAASLLICIQCHAFKRIERRSTVQHLPTLAIHNNLQRFHNHKTRHQQKHHIILSNSASWIYSIRGGSDTVDNGVDEQYGDEFTTDFITSFEAEMADIRREAEQEADQEMQKLRGLIRGDEQEQEDEDDEEEIEKNEDNGDVESNIDLSPQDPVMEEIDNGDLTINEQQQIDTATETEVTGDDKMEIQSEEETAVLNDESEETIDLDGDVNNDEEKEEEEDIVMVEDDDYLDYEEMTELPNESVTIGDYESDAEATGSNNTPQTVEEQPITTVVESIADHDKIVSGDKQDIKPKSAKKKKKKASKQGKEKKKEKKRITVSEEESEPSDTDQQEVDVGDSVMLTRVEEGEVAESQQKGIWYYLRSDLGRALTLFIATVLIAVLTQRMQKQMEEEGIFI